MVALPAHWCVFTSEHMKQHRRADGDANLILMILGVDMVIEGPAGVCSSVDKCAAAAVTAAVGISFSTLVSGQKATFASKRRLIHPGLQARSVIY